MQDTLHFKFNVPRNLIDCLHAVFKTTAWNQKIPLEAISILQHIFYEADLKSKGNTALLTCWRSSVKISVFSALVNAKRILVIYWASRTMLEWIQLAEAKR